MGTHVEPYAGFVQSRLERGAKAPTNPGAAAD